MADSAIDLVETLDSPFLYERGGFFKQLRHEARQLRRYRSLIRYLVGVGLARERRMALGVLWWLIDPILMMLIYVVMIGVILHRGGDIKAFPVFVLVAVIAWKYFTQTVNKSMSGLTGKERLMRQVAFPRTVIPISALLTESVHYMIGIGLTLVIAASIYGVNPTYHIIAVVPVLVIQGMFGLGLGLLAATANVFFRDTQMFLSHVFRLWFYLSPSLYSVGQAATRLHGTAFKIFSLNPFTMIFPASRDAIYYGTWPNWGSLGIVTLISLALLVIGYSVFVHFEPEFNKVS